MKYVLTIILIFSISISQAQNKKVLDHADFDHWNKIKNAQISNNGKWVIYQLQPGYGDLTLKITDGKAKDILTYKRGNKAKINWESSHIIFKIKPELDSVNAQRRNKVKKDKLPKDSLGIFDLKTKTLIKIPRVNSYKIPEKWGSHIAFQIFPEPKPKKEKKDSTKTKEKVKKKNKSKKENKKNGYRLVVKDLTTQQQDTFPFVKEYVFSEKGKKLMFYSSGKDSTFQQGVYMIDLSTNKLLPLCRGKGDYKNFAFDENGAQAVFLVDLDTTKAKIRPFDVLLWKTGQDSATVIANNKAEFMPKEWIINEHFKPYFSKNGKRLFFGTSPKPLLKDTMLLPEEIVNVEVWNYKDSRLHTQQNVELKRDQKKAYMAILNINNGSIQQIGNKDIPNIRTADEGNSNWGLGISDLPYQKYISWEGGPRHQDIYKINLQKNKKELIAKDIRSYLVRISPGGNYIYWFNALDSAWYSHHNMSGKTIKLMDSRKANLTDELNDLPNFPFPYRFAGWTKDDESFLVYDRYDIWQLDPNGKKDAVKLTGGRASKTEFRYVELDEEERFIDPNKTILLHSYNEITRQEGYHSLNLKNKLTKKLIPGNFRFRNVIKAKKSDYLIFTKENFKVFPNIQYSDLSFKKIEKISDANPQQKEYLWGTAEVYKWTSLDGVELEGLLYKPENFDPDKKYPMIVNFYEKSSERLNQHKTPEPHRSTINYSFYLSRGYVIFNPDVHYRIGYPGESSYNCVIPGVTSLIGEGFVDEKRIGVQGHSWGGYQIAYLVTKTDIFAAAEAGAPVPNMISAYGGIRWWTGLSRMFQYEHTQSRIGGTLWEYPIRYIENSPIFFVDKINTPLLIMHNDKDGHVPWYQGIELFVALRRLGKPSWMLNYVGEPHWPQKWQNKKDFNIRMQQYFDHYLKGEKAPVWMEKGIPAIEKGISKGYELIEK
ncbi:MAG: prolyl oligopeptidase family serine peptidase [Bacteroidota bacterium]